LERRPLIFNRWEENEMVCFYYLGHAGVFIRKGNQEDGARSMIAYFFIIRE